MGYCSYCTTLIHGAEENSSLFVAAPEVNSSAPTAVPSCDRSIKAIEYDSHRCTESVTRQEMQLVSKVVHKMLDASKENIIQINTGGTDSVVREHTNQPNDQGNTPTSPHLASLALRFLSSVARPAEPTCSHSRSHQVSVLSGEYQGSCCLACSPVGQQVAPLTMTSELLTVSLANGPFTLKGVGVDIGFNPFATLSSSERMGRRMDAPASPRGALLPSLILGRTLPSPSNGARQLGQPHPWSIAIV
ncbi:hypothetical protein EMCRGX_G002953 [Ephydatia muelleri]